MRGLSLSFEICGCGCGGRRQVFFWRSLFVPVRAKWREVLRQQRQLVADGASGCFGGCFGGQQLGGSSLGPVVAAQPSSNSESVTCITLLKGFFLATSLRATRLAFGLRGAPRSGGGLAQQAASPPPPAGPGELGAAVLLAPSSVERGHRRCVRVVCPRVSVGSRRAAVGPGDDR